MRVVVNVPLHITSMWLPRYAQDPRTTGSLGAGIVISPGVEVTVSDEDAKLRVTGLRHVDEVLRRFGVNVNVEYRAPAPLGFGYGMSGALTLGVALGVATLLRKPLLEAAQVAHEIEVNLGTGLGDVIAEFYGGGIELRVRPGAPGIGVIDKIPYPNDLVVLTHEFAREDTNVMLLRLRDKLEVLGKEFMGEIMREPTYENFVRLSMEFSRRLGFLTEDIEGRVRPCIKYVDGYYVKKGVLVLLTRVDEAPQASDCLTRHGLPTRYFKISDAGAQVRIIR
ncbi:pantoate kinase [Vulcanisaeta thermophila]|uniref:pantoate kinase n=1 Tax=Vulcanisaeta thermophila TaxID=867917 RepID=UPI0008530635|nr:pantoate kinase [Vulcanisaeta thermophila]